MTQPYQIHIRSASERLPWGDLVAILERLLPVKFGLSREGRTEGAGEIIIESSVGWAKGAAVVPGLRVPQSENSSRDGKLVDLAVYFADDREVPFPFRGRSLRTKVAAEPKILSSGSNQKTLASSELGPVWAVSEEGGVKRFRSGFALPDIPPDGNLQGVLNGERFLEMLPLFHWIRGICATSWYEGPPLRACFIFDDPNLHWPRYGFVDFRQIAARAAKENYHVSFATIPLDTWFTHKATAELFRKNANRLSLAIHGNDHTKLELARNYTQPARVFLLRQAIHRIERLERSAGVEVSRVMVPPHGACSEEILEELPACGFEAACISHGSLRAHNKSKAWTRDLGFAPSELIQGCPVLPRWGLSGSTTNTILLAAFLEQPIILRGHHQDLRNGVELLDQLAGFINGLGPVRWSNLTGLSRFNYQWRIQGSTCRLKPLGRKIIFQMPRQATGLVIESPSNGSWESWQISDTDGAVVKVCAGKPVSLSQAFNGDISIEAATAPPVSVENRSNRPAAAAFFRRMLTEGRDRFLSS